MRQTAAGQSGVVERAMYKLTKVALMIVLGQLILMIAVAAPALAQSAPAVSSAFVSGSVFVDANQDHAADPTEINVPFAMVHIQSKADPAVQFVALTDMNGYYVVSGLPFGQYDLWAEGISETAALTITVDLDEVNATSSVDLPVYDNSGDLELTSMRVMYLPIAARHE
jgi:hypothetical protein